MQESSRQKLDDVKLEVSEEIRMQIVELKTRAQNLGEKVPKPARRLLKAFPKTGIQKLQSTAGIVPAKTGTAPWQTLIYPDKNHAAPCVSKHHGCCHTHT